MSACALAVHVTLADVGDRSVAVTPVGGSMVIGPEDPSPEHESSAAAISIIAADFIVCNGRTSLAA
jgi:hypothetical protein